MPASGSPVLGERGTQPSTGPPGSSHGNAGYVSLGGVRMKLSPRWAAPGGSPSSRSSSAGGPAAGGRRALAPVEEADPPPVGIFPG
ncbi:hypothetical protein NDU88_009811 [Pleurodeles waltl]|uniref:Uncharacterized protein n=1 Tax=Pleurodeles waltl TaxID=8319 RepID=A0AAV7PU94_PLEWA|nr:hypothetical protein NDU88_009811 [Pleurodeles waltl]